MKTDLIKFPVQSIKNLRGIFAGLITTLIFFNMLPKAWGAADLFWQDDATPATAGGGTWTTVSFSGLGIWSTSQTSNTNGPWVNANDNTANFIGSVGGTVTLETPITAAGITFGSGAGPFIIDTSGNTLTIDGAGIVNTSGNTQTIINEFPPPGLGTVAGSTFFFGASSAGNVTIINNGDSTEFHDVSNAGSATIINNGGAAGGSGGFTEFFGSSSAGSATITNNGGTAGNSGGFTEFLNNSTAGNATIITNGGTGGGPGGSTLFVDSADGGTARAITNGNGSFDISGLTTAGMKIGSVEGSGNYFLGSKTLTVGGNNLSTAVSGIIHDGGSSGGTGGSLTKVGTGTLTLIGANSYSGGTNLNGGIIAVNSDINLGTGALRFNGGTLEALPSGGGIVSSKAVTLNSAGGTFLADAGTASTLSGAITGTGSWTKAGPGILTLSGANTYSGATIINAGVLQAGSSGAFSVRSAFSVNTGAVLDLNGFSNALGSLSGSGLVSNSGGTGALSNATLSVGADNTSTTFSGTLRDGARTLALTKVGAGTLILAANNTYTGTTTVNAGNLIVDGSIASLQTLVNAGGLLGGHGFLGGSLVNNGIVSPGNSPGTLTVNNNYTQNASGTLRIEVAGLAQTQHDLLAVNGHVTLGGTLQIVRLGSFNLQPGNQVVFLTAQNGISGAFNTVQNDFATGTIVQGVILVLPDEVLLEGKQAPFASLPGLTPNELAVARMLDSAAGDPRAAALFAFLNSQPLANLPHDLELIAPIGITSINATAVSIGNLQMFNLEQRLDNIRGGSTGFSSAGFAISGGTASFGEGFAGVSGPEGKSGPPVFAPTPTNRWGVFLTGLGEFTTVDSTFNAPGYDVNTGGFTLGIDYRLTPNFAVGLSAGYAHTSIGLDNGGNIDANAGKIGMYATVFGNGFYLDTAVSGGPSGYSTRRTALQGTANGSTNGGDFYFLVAGGYDWTKGNLTIGPTASFQYDYVEFDGFTETGSLAPLTFPRQNTESERTAFGAKASYEWKIGNITAIPQVSAGWQHEFGSTEYAVVASLASGAGNSFTVHGPQIGRDSVLIGAGSTVILNERVSLYLYYDGQFARTNYLSNNVSGGVRISF